MGKISHRFYILKSASEWGKIGVVWGKIDVEWGKIGVEWDKIGVLCLQHAKSYTKEERLVFYICNMLGHIPESLTLSRYIAFRHLLDFKSKVNSADWSLVDLPFQTLQGQLACCMCMFMCVCLTPIFQKNQGIGGWVIPIR